MALANLFAQFNANNAALQQAAAPNGPLEKLRAALSKAGELERALPLIQNRVAARLTGAVRSALLASYSASRLGTFSKDYKSTGQLRAAVASSVVVATPRGLRISMPAGLPNKLYARAGALEYGAVRGLQGGKSVRKRAGKLLRQRGAQTGEAKIGGMSFVQPHEYYNIDDALGQLEQLYAKYFQEEVDAFLGRR